MVCKQRDTQYLSSKPSQLFFYLNYLQEGEMECK